METIKQQLNIPANRQVKLDVILSDEIPVGAAEMIMVVVSHSRSQNSRRNIMELAGCLRYSKALRGDPVSIQKGLRDEWRALATGHEYYHRLFKGRDKVNTCQ